MESIGHRIKRLRVGKGWSRPELGRQMAKAIGREKPFSGEVVRLYEEDANDPGADARRALAQVFDRTEAYIEFGSATEPATVARQAEATYGLSPAALKVAKGFDQLSPECQEHVERQIELLRSSDGENGRRAAQHDVEIRQGRYSAARREKKRAK